MTEGDIQTRFNFIPNRLLTSRTQKGWSRQELAERIGRSEDDICAIESGKIKDELGTIYLICDELGLNFKEMFEQKPSNDVVIPFRQPARL